MNFGAYVVYQIKFYVEQFIYEKNYASLGQKLEHSSQSKRKNKYRPVERGTVVESNGLLGDYHMDSKQLRNKLKCSKKGWMIVYRKIQAFNEITMKRIQFSFNGRKWNSSTKKHKQRELISKTNQYAYFVLLLHRSIDGIQFKWWIKFISFVDTISAGQKAFSKVFRIKPLICLNEFFYWNKQFQFRMCCILFWSFVLCFPCIEFLFKLQFLCIFPVKPRKNNNSKKNRTKSWLEFRIDIKR